MVNVYRFKISYDDNFEYYQYRYVVAESEDEAVAKLEQYRLERHRDGDALFDIDYDPFVEADDVIL